MIGHIEHGSDFGGLFRYLLAEDKGARIIGGLAAGRTAFELTQEFNNCADQRRTTTKPVKHLIVSFSPTDGYVTDDVKAKIASEAVEELGYTYNQYVVVDHHRDDPGHDWNHDHDHIHIAVNMITLDGKRVDDWQDKTKFEKILAELAIEENLTQIAPSSDRKFKAISHGQTQRIKREIKEFKQGERTKLPEIPLMSKLQAAIDSASKDKPDLTTFIGRLQHLGIDVRPTISDKGRKRISYRLSEIKVRGSKLHNASFPKLISNRGLNFDLDRDKPAMAAACLGQEVNIPIEKQITWSGIDLVSYLPTILQEEMKIARSSLQQKNTRRDDVGYPKAEINWNAISDRELLAIYSSVEYWRKNCPQRPAKEVIVNIQTRIQDLKKQGNKEKQKIENHIRELEQLGKPRSLLNPFGVSMETIDEKNKIIQLNRAFLETIEDKLKIINRNLKNLQNKDRAFQEWRESDKTKEMSQLAKLLQSSSIIARLEQIKERQEVYHSVRYILEQRGKLSDSLCRFQGKIYSIEERGDTLTMSRIDDNSILLVANDLREQGESIEIELFDLTERDKENIFKSVRFLEQELENERHQKSQQNDGWEIG